MDSRILRIVRQMIDSDIDPRHFCSQIGLDFPDDMPRVEIFRVLIRVLGVKTKRKRTRKYNLNETVDLIRNSKKILVLTGAGISVSCGIPDFRSRNGLYAKLAVDFPELPDPQSMFCLTFFKSDPRPFFRFAKEIFPGNFAPSPSHNFIAQLEKNEKMKRLYSQNIDGLEKQAGIDKVIQCHGHFYTAHCLNSSCRTEYKISDLKKRIFESKVPYCDTPIVKHTAMEAEAYHEEVLKLPPGDPKLEEIRTKFFQKEKEPCNAVIKPDIVFFGESLPSHFHRHMAMDQDDVDLLIVMGSSLKVGPVNDIPDAIDESVPRILINREPLPHMPEFESELLGNCDEIVEYISSKLEYDIGVTKKEFVNCEWDKMCEVSAQKLAEELKKKEAEELKKKETEELKKKQAEQSDCSKDEKMNSDVSVDSVTNHEPPEKKARTDCVPIEEDPNNPAHVPEQNENLPDSDSDSETDIDQPVVEVKLGEYIAAPSGFQTLFHGCELPIHRLIEDANDSEDDEDGHADTNLGSDAPPSGDMASDEAKPTGSEAENSFANPSDGSKSGDPIDSASSGPTSSPGNKVQNEEKTENPSSLETES